MTICIPTAGGVLEYRRPNECPDILAGSVLMSVPVLKYRQAQGPNECRQGPNDCPGSVLMCRQCVLMCRQRPMSVLMCSQIRQAGSVSCYAGSVLFMQAVSYSCRQCPIHAGSVLLMQAVCPIKCPDMQTVS